MFKESTIRIVWIGGKEVVLDPRKLLIFFKILKLWCCGFFLSFFANSFWSYSRFWIYGAVFMYPDLFLAFPMTSIFFSKLVPCPQLIEWFAP